MNHSSTTPPAAPPPSPAPQAAKAFPRIAYLVNQYPKTSHVFIRREILALEALGFEVLRYSLRSVKEKLADPIDQQEKKITQAILDGGALGLLAGLLWALFTRPGRFSRTIALALKVGRRGERGIFYHLIYTAEACVLARALMTKNVRHVHAHFGTNSTTVVMLAHELGGPPFSFTVHGPDEFDTATTMSLDEKIGRCAFVAAISLFGRSQLMRWCDPRDWHKVQIVRCGVDDYFLHVKQTPVPEAPRFVCVGRLCGQKAQLLLVEAVAKLVQRKIPVSLVLVGDGEMRPQVEALIAEHGLQGIVTITGWASSEVVREQLLAARVFCLPSFAEGLPVVIMEALALGRPVISTTIAGIPELVVNGVNGWLVPPGAVDPLVAAMREAIEAPAEKLEAMGLAGAARVQKDHNIALIAEGLADLIRASAR
jgi:colanic acid/amylovoran biosynthesis glycosyltransferase